MAVELLFIVADVFEIRQRGCVLLPGPRLDAGAGLTIGDRLRLITPDGRETDTVVAGA